MTIDSKPRYGSQISVQGELTQQFQVFFDDIEQLLNASLLGPVVQLPIYTVATLPDQFEAGLVYVSDETGGAVPAFSDGTNWLRVTDRAIVS